MHHRAGQLQQGGLAGPVRADDDPPLIQLDGPVDIVEQHLVAAPHGHPDQLQHGIGIHLGHAHIQPHRS
jgi:hypothetical protein